MKWAVGLLEYDIKCTRCGNDTGLVFVIAELAQQCVYCGRYDTVKDLMRYAELTGNVYNPLIEEFTKGNSPP